ncbi:Transcriptional antiterminator [Pelosinus fermentans]|uniref:Phosphoenolpyruvate-dependent sugar phosphotransferase system EIIA 2 n=2 Tax=Sporomusaceae TaxID=1843490 RepID=I9LBY1_9FIRM|nr:phosphoenolpyruvate-dependent sugar phosphotransferase system EIIA 2 [Pelosinus fermentans B4]EIW23778.1 PTS modulated transcriptional regulator, MtlR family [Pelosinus fermentans A11]OAM94701.1 PTS modulated transcriptional regulator, MtlR family [Pelosinus fermentans DSM 17108]SDR15732.1 Transcriptional antiterminator [Pelosinus fermentans]
MSQLVRQILLFYEWLSMLYNGNEKEVICITLNEMSAQLFQRITSSNQAVTISALAEALHSTPRQIRYKLDKIDEFLKYNKFPQFLRKPNVGITYTAPPQVVERIMQKLLERENHHYIASQEERVEMILAVLLQQQNYMTIDDLGERLKTSRSTVIKDLNKVREVLKSNHLTLLSSTNHGIKIIGEEKYLRRASIELLMKSIEVQGMLSQEMSPMLKNIKTLSQSEISNMFTNMNIPFIESCVIEAEKQLETTFSDEAFYGLVIHIAIAIKRIKLGRDIVMPYNELKSYETTKEFAAASYVASRLEAEFQIEVPYDEIGYITIHLLGSNVYAANSSSSEEWAALQIITGKILEEVSESLQQESLIQDEHLFSGLLEHLRPAIYRLKNDLKLKNPVLEEIKVRYHHLFQIVKNSMASVEGYIGKSFDDEEIGYFTLHFGAALEKLKDKKEMEKRILVVCSTGLGTARLLSSRLQQLFQVNIVDVIAYRQIGQILKYQEVDLIITTLPIKCDAVPWVQVNPMLLDKDVENLKKYLTQYHFQPKNIFIQTLRLIEEHCDIKNYDALVTGLAKILKTDNVGQKGVVQPLLRELLTADMIEVKVKAKSWEEVIYAGGKLLEDRGLIEHRYVDAMVNTVKKMGAYIVIAKGIAMPHARPEDGAKKVGMALMTLKNPVNFGSKENDPVSVAVFLCAVDNTTHLKALAELMQLLDDEEFKTMADTASSKDEILAYINSKEVDRR